MLANQGEITQLMIKAHILQPPAGLVVARFTLFPQLVLVCIFVFMAAITGLVGFYIECVCLVTGLAAGFFMGTS